MIGYAMGFGQNTAKWLAGDEMPTEKLIEEAPQTVLVLAGVVMSAGTKFVSVTHNYPALAAGHPGKIAAASEALSTPAMIKGLRDIGTPEALATAKVLKRSEVIYEPVLGATNKGTNLKMIYDASGEAVGYERIIDGYMGEQIMGTRRIIIAVDKNPTFWEGMETASHEAKHLIQHLTPSTYRQIHEFEAEMWAMAATIQDPAQRPSSLIIYQWVKEKFPYLKP
jgi:hypothetical protein